MAAYIGRIQDADSNDVYPQTKANGVIDLDQRFLSEAGNTDWVTEGITFLNGAYDWSKKGDKKVYSGFRKVKNGLVDTVYLKLDIGIGKKLAQRKELEVARMPEDIKLNGTNFFVGNNNIRWIVIDGKVSVYAENGEINPDVRLQIAMSYITPHNKKGGA